MEIHQAHEGRDHEEAPCPGIVGMLIHGQEEYAKFLMGGGSPYTRTIPGGIRQHPVDRRQKEDEGRHGR